MSFQDQLNDELEKRDLSDQDAAFQQTKTVKFSIKTFLIGLGLGAFVLGGLTGWAHLQSTKTQDNLVKRLPSKTALIETTNNEIFRMSQTQPTLTMKPSESATNTQTNIDTSAVNTDGLADEEKAITAFIKENEDQSIDEEVTEIIESSKPVQLYRQSFNDTKKPNLSFIITDLGLSRERTENLIKDLPGNVTLALSPYVENLNALTTTAREDGHEVWLMLPIQTADYPLVDSGPLTLLSDASMAQNSARMNTLLSLAQGHVGFVANKDHSFKSEDANINPAIKSLLSKGFGIIDSNTSGRSFLKDLSYKNEYPYAQNNFWLDENLTQLALNQKLRQIIELAEASGNVTIMMRPYPASIKALQKFLNSAAAKKFELTPASAALRNAT